MQNATRIHNRYYNLTAFLDKHPGGRTALKMAFGRDATILFESHHPFTSPALLASILGRYEIVCPLDTANDGQLIEEMDADAAIFTEWGKSEFVKDLVASVRVHFLAESKRRGMFYNEV